MEPQSRLVFKVLHAFKLANHFKHIASWRICQLITSSTIRILPIRASSGVHSTSPTLVLIILAVSVCIQGLLIQLFKHDLMNQMFCIVFMNFSQCLEMCVCVPNQVCSLMNSVQGQNTRITITLFLFWFCYFNQFSLLLNIPFCLHKIHLAKIKPPVIKQPNSLFCVVERNYH